MPRLMGKQLRAAVNVATVENKRHRHLVCFSRSLAKIAIAVALICSPFLSPERELRADPIQGEGDQFLDLMFPASSPWAERPIVKWDHRPHGVIIVEGDLSVAERDSVKQAIQGVEANAPVADLQYIETAAPSDKLAAAALATDFTIIFGSHAIEESRGAYRAVLVSVLQSNVDPDLVVDDVIGQGQPAFSKYRFDIPTGRLNQFVTFADGNGDPYRMSHIAYLAILTSLSPSVVYSGSLPGLISRKDAEATVTRLGYSYLRFLYSNHVPMGSHIDDVRKSLSEQ